MTGDVVIRAEGLGKKYVIGHQAEREHYIALRDVVARGARSLSRKAADLMRGRSLLADDTLEEYWALKGVSFEVKRGEVLGIIGRNGAGKSTLLKILSRITEPSEGRVGIKGRVASLLEVGTGFHPELTGRENIYLNGAILGMSRAEIRRKFDEIVDFAGVEKFIDTPVKRYSSGMYVRLAFAVAAHLEPEILVIDEVLAVGDADFQKKCLGKMSEIAVGGRTVLFVSHNLPAVASLCTGGLLLDKGALTYRGEASAVISSYLGQTRAAQIVKGRRVDLRGRVLMTELGSHGAIRLIFDITIRGPLKRPRIGLGINNGEGVRIATIFAETGSPLPVIAEGTSKRIRICTEPIRLSAGTLSIKLALVDESIEIEVHEDALQLLIPDYVPFDRPPASRPRGSILIRCSVEIHEELPSIPA